MVPHRKLPKVWRSFFEIGASPMPRFRFGMEQNNHEQFADMDRDDMFFSETNDAPEDARELATEAIRRLLVWMADAPTLEDRGLRASVALYCLRPDLIEGATLEKMGDATGRTRQSVFNLARDFRLTIDAL
jgi:hypothetical protein